MTEKVPENGSPKSGLNLQKPTGTLDLLPEDMDKRRWITRFIEDHFRSFGFQQIMIPTYDFYNLYRLRSGEKIINDIFTFYDPPGHRKEINPELYALRPEFTAPLCRFYITSELMYRPKPQKFFYVGTCFRYDEPQPGRYREFTQAGVELFGSDSYVADAEIIILAMQLMEKLGLQEYLLRINDLTFLRTYLEEQQIHEEMQNKIFGVIDKVASYMRKVEIKAITDHTIEDFTNDYYGMMNDLKMDRDLTEKLEKLLYLVGKPEEVTTKLLEIFNDNPKTVEAIKNSNIPKVCQLIDAAGLGRYVVDCGIARGLDYYTNLVFEIDVPALGKEKQVCGGGRYNKLVEEYGGEHTPATGFAFGLDRLIIALERLKKIQPEPYRADVYIATKPETTAFGVKVANQLRTAGIRVEIDIMERTFKNVSKFVNTVNIPFLAFLGPKEMESNKITIKDFRSQTQYENLSIEETINTIKQKL